MLESVGVRLLAIIDPNGREHDARLEAKPEFVTLDSRRAKGTIREPEP